MADLYLALLHHPVLNKNGQIVTTALTNMDIHDIARSARTFGVRKFFVLHPIPALRALSEKIIEHWERGFGAAYNRTRKDALSLVAINTDLDAAIVAIERESGRKPVLVSTSARRGEVSVSFAALRERLERTDDPYLILLGTGWGLSPQILARAELRLEPIIGVGEYNHLSVRSAAAIILDRLCGAR